ncbi:class A beta-lactamase-related serine hydrolase [Patescibacteria group bacterium]|nr:class A beta-lactamase-related serine hydrolase [Patescibacteria group bacterium]
MWIIDMKKQSFVFAGLITVIAFAIGATVGSSYILKKHEDHPFTSPEKSPDYTFINPLYEQVENKPLLTREVEELKSAIESATTEAVSEKIIDYGSVYYRDLNNGPWFSVGDEHSFKPASLFKVPIMIGFFKIAETNPEILEKKVTYSTPYENVAQHLVDSSTTTIEVGKTYTINELIEYMIIYSDNLAAYLLLENIDPLIVVQVFEDLGIPSKEDTEALEGFGPRTYASYLRILYNSTYLNPEYSEKALEILSRSTFNHGMRSVLIPGVKAGLKYGIAIEPSGKKQLHECGIIYWQEYRPHVLCIMTTGNDYEQMATYITDVTQLVQAAILK